MNTVQGKRLAEFLRQQGIDGGRVVRLLVGAAAPRFGDYTLLLDASFVASGNYARKVTGIEELYEELQGCAESVGRVTGYSGYISADIVNLPK